MPVHVLASVTSFGDWFPGLRVGGKPVVHRACELWRSKRGTRVTGCVRARHLVHMAKEGSGVSSVRFAQNLYPAAPVKPRPDVLVLPARPKVLPGSGQRTGLTSTPTPSMEPPVTPDKTSHKRPASAVEDSNRSGPSTPPGSQASFGTPGEGVLVPPDVGLGTVDSKSPT